MRQDHRPCRQGLEEATVFAEESFKRLGPRVRGQIDELDLRRIPSDRDRKFVTEVVWAAPLRLAVNRWHVAWQQGHGNPIALCEQCDLVRFCREPFRVWFTEDEVEQHQLPRNMRGTRVAPIAIVLVP